MEQRRPHHGDRHGPEGPCAQYARQLPAPPLFDVERSGEEESHQKPADEASHVGRVVYPVLGETEDQRVGHEYRQYVPIALHERQGQVVVLPQQEGQHAPDDAEDGPRGPRAVHARVPEQARETRRHAGEKIEREKIDASEKFLHHAADVVEHPHVEEDVHETEMDEQARKKAPPLAVHGQRAEVRAPVDGHLGVDLVEPGAGQPHEQVDEDVGGDEAARHDRCGVQFLEFDLKVGVLGGGIEKISRGDPGQATGYGRRIRLAPGLEGDQEGRRAFRPDLQADVPSRTGDIDDLAHRKARIDGHGRTEVPVLLPHDPNRILVYVDASLAQEAQAAGRRPGEDPSPRRRAESDLEGSARRRSAAGLVGIRETHRPAVRDRGVFPGLFVVVSHGTSPVIYDIVPYAPANRASVSSSAHSHSEPLNLIGQARFAGKGARRPGDDGGQRGRPRHPRLLPVLTGPDGVPTHPRNPHRARTRRPSRSRADDVQPPEAKTFLSSSVVRAAGSFRMRFSCWPRTVNRPFRVLFVT